jgi:hypothetical protein
MGDELVAVVRPCCLRRRQSQGRRGLQRGVAWDRGHVQRAELVFSVLVLVGRGGPARYSLRLYRCFAQPGR